MQPNRMTHRDGVDVFIETRSEVSPWEPFRHLKRQERTGAEHLPRVGRIRVCRRSLFVCCRPTFALADAMDKRIEVRILWN